MTGTPQMNRHFGLMILVFSILSGDVFAQTNEMQGLIDEAKRAGTKREKSDRYSALAEQYYSYDFEQGLNFAREALRLAQEDNYVLGQAKALTTIGTYHYYSGENSLSRQSYQEALRVVAHSPVEDFPARTYLRLAIFFRQQAAFDSADFYLDKVIPFLQNKKESSLYAYYLATRGMLLNEQSKQREAIRYHLKALALRLNLKDSTRLPYSWASLGAAYSALANYDSAEICYAHARYFVDKKVADSEVTMMLNLWQGETSYVQGNFQKASEFYAQALNSVSQNTYKRYYYRIMFRIGELYENQGAYHTAYEYLFDALKEFEKISARKDMASAMAQIGWCYAYQDNFEEARKNAEQALAISQQIGDSAGIGLAQNLIGFSLYKTGKYNEGLVALEQAVAIRKKIEHWWGVSFSLYNTALVHFQLGHNEKGFELLHEALAIDERIGKKTGIAFNCNELGYQYARQRNFSSAAKFLKTAQTVSSEIPIPPQLLINYKHYIFYYEQQGDARHAAKYYKLYNALKDSLTNDLNTSRISKVDALFRLQKKASEIELVNKENELSQQKIKMQESEISFQRTVIIFVIVILVGLSALITIIYRLLKLNRRANQVLSEQQDEIVAQAERIKEVNAELEAINDQLEKRVEERTTEMNRAYTELETFFYRTSHDFRRPLTTYLGLVEIAKTTLQDKQAIDLFEKVKETTIGLDSMLYKLQSISDADSLAETTAIDLEALVDQCCQKYARIIAEKGIEIQKDIDVGLVNTSRPLLELMVSNLLENSIQFCSPMSPFIKISARQIRSKVMITVADNGQGIPAKGRDKIFTMYYRASANSKGNGLGLYIVKRAVEKLGGSVSFTSTQFEGSAFELLVPSEPMA